MNNQATIAILIGAYPEEIRGLVLETQRLLEKLLPDCEIIVDIPAKMIAFTYGMGYSDMICVLIPSRNEVKISFSKGQELTDPAQLLEGKGTKSRYVRIQRMAQLRNNDLHLLIQRADNYYHNIQLIKGKR